MRTQSEVPTDLDFEGLLWWMRRYGRLLAGNEVAISDFLDRLFAKPRRVELTGAGGGPLRAAGAASPEEIEQAEDYYEQLAEGKE